MTGITGSVSSSRGCRRSPEASEFSPEISESLELLLGTIEKLELQEQCLIDGICGAPLSESKTHHALGNVLKQQKQ